MREVTTYVWYKVMSGDTVTRDCPADNCFASITYLPIPTDTTLIEVYIPKKYVPYSENYVKRWIDLLIEFGFNVSYKGIKETLVHYSRWTYPTKPAETGDCYYFHVPVNEAKGINSKRVELNSLLILIRYLWENGNSRIPAFFFAKSRNVEDVDEKFKIFQMVQPVVKQGGLNHRVVTKCKDIPFSVKEFWKKVDKATISVFAEGKVGVSAFWSCD